MVAIHIEHKLDVGILTISRINTEIVPSETDGEPRMNDIIQFRFECDATGAWFDADMDRADLSKMCTILGEDDELIETLNDPPSVVISGQNVMTATFMAAGRKRKYPVVISLTKRTYAADKQDIMELRAENAVLRRKVASLEERVSILEDDSNEHQTSISLFAAHLLTMHGGEHEYIKYTKRYPCMISVDDKPISICGGNVRDIMEWKDSELLHNLRIYNVITPLIESILSMDIRSNPHVNLHTREKLVENISSILELHTNDQTTFANGIKLIDFINNQISISSQPNHQSYSDHNVWVKFKKCVETEFRYEIRSSLK